MEKFTDDFDQEIWVHNKEDCKGEYCVIHGPSDHHMREWSMSF